MSKPRYLTASKISLLILVKLYCTVGVPSSATIPVLSFILSHSFPTTPSAARAPRSAKQHDVAFSIRAFEDVLQKHASSMPGRSLLDVFLKHVWEMNSFDALFDLFDSLGELLARPQEDAPQDEPAGRVCLSQTSPLGALIRRARVEFVRLPFDDAIRLWTAFVAYRAPSAHWSKRLAGLASSGVDIVAADMGLKPGDSLYESAYGRLSNEEIEEHAMSLDDLDRLLEFQLDRLQRKSLLQSYICIMLNYYRPWLPRSGRNERSSARYARIIRHCTSPGSFGAVL
jgi:anaphase-promoting complex subunit 5